ncbi:MAG TPA: hypothetical protein PLQ82_09045 [Desulfobacteraceae bacterium]|nr:hypothetical protein [Desulfobacteraceae bacterium]
MKNKNELLLPKLRGYLTAFYQPFTSLRLVGWLADTCLPLAD